MRAAFLAEPSIQAIDGPALTKLCNAISTTVVDHIKAAAVVTVPSGVAVVVAVPAGTGATVAPGVGAIT